MAADKPSSCLRWPILIMGCVMMIGSYYCYDNPAALSNVMMNETGWGMTGIEFQMQCVTAASQLPLLCLLAQPRMFATCTPLFNMLWPQIYFANTLLVALSCLAPLCLSTPCLQIHCVQPPKHRSAVRGWPCRGQIRDAHGAHGFHLLYCGRSSGVRPWCHPVPEFGLAGNPVLRPFHIWPWW